MEKFITYVAWGIGIPATALFVFSIFASIDDFAKGIDSKYPICTAFVVSIPCWAWILSH